VTSGLVSQGLAIFDAVRNGLSQYDDESADERQVVPYKSKDGS
jgi:flotillin